VISSIENQKCVRSVLKHTSIVPFCMALSRLCSIDIGLLQVLLSWVFFLLGIKIGGVCQLFPMLNTPQSFPLSECIYQFSQSYGVVFCDSLLVSDCVKNVYIFERISLKLLGMEACSIRVY